jgi:hypothetical protein
MPSRSARLENCSTVSFGSQISLINAYAPLGLETLLTDADWFTGGWPNGAGNWDACKQRHKGMQCAY